MKTKTFKALSLIVAFLVAVVLTVGYVFAWFVNRKDSDLKINGTSAGAYFDSGNGSEETPFVIANPTHMHNLAVLQNSGKFVDREGNPKKYYFEIKKTVDTIDMSGRYIPPIGNDQNPFIGDFDGNGKTLANLQVTTNKELLRDEYPRHAEASYEFSQAVGLFGMTGSSSDIHNVILENPSVDVSAVNTLYSSTKNAVAGLAVGFVAGKCSSVGVRAKGDGSELSVNKTGYSTFNSILGALDDNVTSAVTGGGHGVGGSGAAFGATFDIASMVARLEKIYEGKYGVKYAKGNKNKPLATSSVMLPTVDTQNSVPVPGEGAQLAFTATDTDKLDYSASDAVEKISDQNVGYFLGNQNKFDTKQFTFINRMVPPLTTNWQGKVFIKDSWSDTIDLYLDENTGKPYILGNNDEKTYVTIQQDSDGDYVYNGQKLSHNKDLDWRTYKSNNVSSTNVPAWFYTFNNTNSDNAGNGCYSSQTFRELTDAEFADLPANVKNILPAIGSQKPFTTIRISQDGVSTMNYGNTEKTQWSYHGQISWMGKTYGKGFRSNDGYPVDEQGNILTDCNDEFGNQLVYSAYTNGVALPNSSIWFKPAQSGKFRFIMYSQSDGDGFILDKIVRTNADKDNPFKVDTDFNVHGDDVELTTIIKQRIPTGILFYYEYNVSDEEIEAGNVEFMLQKNGSGGAHFIYLDIGASATDEDTSVINREKAVSAVDFIYDGVEIKQGNPADDAADALIKVGDFIVKTSGEEVELYEASKTSVYFDDLKAILNLVFLRLHNDSVDKHSGKTICLEQSNPVPDKNSEVKATFATYVCPTIGGGSGTVSGGGGTVTPTPGPGPDNPDDVAVTSVSISGAPATMTVGGTATLTATVLPNDATDKTVTWTSSNESIATVADGVVTAKAAGTVTITATAGGKSDSVTITVEASQYHSGTYTLNANSTDSMVTNNGATESGSTWVLGGNAQTVNLALNVQEGKVITISVRGKRNSDKAEGINVYLGNSNAGTKLGTIDLTSTEAEGIGTVQYTATADGYVYLALGRSAAGGTILSEITVTISDGGTVTPTPTVSEVTVTPATATVAVGGTTSLSASVTMSDGSDYSGTVEWTTSDSGKATVSNGVVTAKAAGEVTITATAGGKSATCTVKVEDTTTGGNDLLAGFTTPSSNGSNFIDNDYLSVKSSAKAEQVTLTDSAFDMSFPNAVRSSGNKNTLTFTAKQDITLTVYYCSTNGTTIKDNTINVGYPSGVTGNDTVSDNYIHKLVVTLQSGQSLTIATTSDRTCLLALFAE